jgi:hypothetical protein
MMALLPIVWHWSPVEIEASVYQSPWPFEMLAIKPLLLLEMELRRLKRRV